MGLVIIAWIVNLVALYFVVSVAVDASATGQALREIRDLLQQMANDRLILSGERPAKDASQANNDQTQTERCPACGARVKSDTPVCPTCGLTLIDQG